MSRARPIECPDRETLWVDTLRNNEKATEEQLELLMTVEAVELDDLLEEDPTQGEAVTRLRRLLGQDTIPPAVIKRRERLRGERQQRPTCRRCGQRGNSTKHHFVNKWILRELDNYAQKWADRSKNCISLCIECHRNIHSRDEGVHSMVDLLTDEEKGFVEAALQALEQEHPSLLILVGRGDSSVYESRLVKDWIEGYFRT